MNTSQMVIPDAAKRRSGIGEPDTLFREMNCREICASPIPARAELRRDDEGEKLCAATFHLPDERTSLCF